MTNFAIDTYYQFAFSRIDKNLRWVQFECMPWINRDGGSYEIIVVFSDRDREIESLSLSTVDGQPIVTTVEPIIDLPKALSKFQDLPEVFRDFYRVTFDLNQPEAVVGSAMCEGERISLFTLNPRLQYPDFIFDIVSGAALKHPEIKYKSMIETGTLYGHTAIHASKYFDNVYTIELDEKLYANAKNINQSIANIEFIQGDSGVEINNLLSRLEHPTVFFLDAHWSGDSTVNWNSSAFSGFPTNTSHTGEAGTVAPSSAEQVPLDREISAILERFPFEALIIIDDWQSVGKKDHAFAGEDWSHLSQSHLIHQFRDNKRTNFQYPYDDKHYVVGLNKQRI